MFRKAALPLIVALGCAHPSALAGPPAPLVGDLAQVEVTSLEAPERSTIISNPSAVAAIATSWAFAEQGWACAEGRELLPLYRIELRGATKSVYWLGANSHPPRFPCYRLCTGWWVAPSTEAGELDTTLYKGLPRSVYFRLLQDLELPARVADS